MPLIHRLRQPHTRNMTRAARTVVISIVPVTATP